jgi:formylglycine-generating enzyme required for sulfatase activity
VFLNAENTATTINGATISAAKGHAIQLNSIGASGSPALLTISDGVVTSACEYVSNGGTIFVANSGTASTLYPTVLITGGEVNNTSTNGFAINNDAVNGIVNISGGTVTVSGGHGTCIVNAGALTISNTATVSATADGDRALSNGGTANIQAGTITALDGMAIENGGTGTVTVSGGTVSSANTNSAYGTISSTGTISLQGGTVSNTNAANNAVYINAGYLQLGNSTVSGLINVLDTDYPQRGLWSNYAGDNLRIHTFHVRRTATPFMGQAGDIIFAKDSIDNVSPSTNAENILPFFDISNAIKITGLVLIAAPDGDLELGATQYFIPVNRHIRARFVVSAIPVPPVAPFAPASCGVSTSDNLTFTCIADTNAVAYEWFVGDVSQGETTLNTVTFATTQSNVSVAYLYPPAFLKPVMKDVTGNGGSATWYWGTTPPGTATTVSIPNFKMSETPVTQAQFSAVMGDVTPSYYFSCSGSYNTQGGIAYRPNSALPAENIKTLVCCNSYCNKLSLLEGKTPVYAVAGVSDWAALPYANIPLSSTDANWDAATCNFAANGYRLPTQSEWEYAARGGTANVHKVFSGSAYTYSGSFSDTQEAKDSLDLVAWNTNNTGTSGATAAPFYGTKPVKTKRANVFGLYDMSGNVWEWCWNWGDETFPMATPSATVASTGGTTRVNRGGYWNTPTNSCRVSPRNNSTPNNRSPGVGFRVVVAP